jgi:hypothetical protein
LIDLVTISDFPSIVAIHGLNGDMTRTWTDPESKTVWLRDLLPAAVPRSRIYSFGYDSAYLFSSSVATIEDFANDLLSRLRGVRIEVGPALSPQNGLVECVANHLRTRG